MASDLRLVRDADASVLLNLVITDEHLHTHVHNQEYINAGAGSAVVAASTAHLWFLMMAAGRLPVVLNSCAVNQVISLTKYGKESNEATIGMWWQLDIQPNIRHGWG